MGINHIVSEALLSSNNHYKRLHEQHEQLKKEIEHVRSAPAFDPTKLTMMKRKKLLLVDKMNSIEAALAS